MEPEADEPEKPSITAKEVAAWMADEFVKQGELHQQDIVWDIEKKFGNEFVYTNENGHQAINKKVLKEFASLTANSAVWNGQKKYWRQREKWDPPARRVR